LGLSEVIKAAQEGSVMTSYFDAMMPAIRKALCDSNPDVREVSFILFYFILCYASLT